MNLETMVDTQNMGQNYQKLENLPQFMDKLPWKL